MANPEHPLVKTRQFRMTPINGQAWHGVTNVRRKKKKGKKHRKMKPRNLVVCPVCGAGVSHKRLESHVGRVHGQIQSKPQNQVCLDYLTQ